jgi:thioredoxin reductase
MASAIYAARAGLTPLVIAPSMGGQLQGKGVDVENYPGLHNMTGPAVIASMRSQAAQFGAVFEEDMVTGIDASTRPLKVITNNTGGIETHSIIVATGADSKWLGIPGEYELRGGGVSSCATCDGFLFSGRHVIVVGGGDAAMEDALVLARTSKKVTLIHRRDTFRASKVLADRVKSHPLIDIEWNTVLEKIVGKALPNENNEGDEVDLDSDAPVDKVVSGVVLKDVVTGETRSMDCDAVFVAIGHLPNTGFLEGVVEFDPEHAGYVKTYGHSTKTSVPGIFASGDVTDAVYRQAITSAGSGAAAALDAERYLSEEGLGNEAAELEAELLAELAGEKSGEEKLGYNAYEEAGGRIHGIRESVLGTEL